MKHQLDISLKKVSDKFNKNGGFRAVIGKEGSYSYEQLLNEVIEGENLYVLKDEDQFTFKFINKNGNGFISWDNRFDPKWVSEGGHKLTIPWHTFKDLFEEGKARGEPVAIMAALRTRGGKAGAKTQLHRARAYFDTWIETHPDSKDDFSKMYWGKV